jgi:AmmeMemoRadiSam system protein A
MELSAESRLALLSLARDSIRGAFEKRAARRPRSNRELEQPGGAFVTLEKAGQLRGCIGRMESSSPILTIVEEMAKAAAFDDPRFPSLSSEELDTVRIEISLLTPRHPLESLDDIEVGRHGLFIQRGLQSGVLLPQVASDRGWDRKKFLEETCRKAGLPLDAWQNGETRILAFEATIFGEGEDPHPGALV